MARKKTEAPDSQDAAINVDAVRSDLAALDEITAINEETATFLTALGDELAVSLPRKYDEDLYVDMAKDALIEHSMAGWRLGVILLAIHSQTAGSMEFANVVKDRIGLNKSQAYTYMATTKRFANADGLKLLQKLRTAGVTSFTKIALLQSRTNSEIEAMFEDEGLDGVTADDVAEMSVRQLQNALREARSELVKGTAQLDAAQKKLAAEKKAAKRAASVDPHGQRVQQFEHDIVDATGTAAKFASVDLVKIVEDLHAEVNEEEDALVLDGLLKERADTAIKQGFERVVNALREAAARLGIDPLTIGITGEEFMPADYE